VGDAPFLVKYLLKMTHFLRKMPTSITIYADVLCMVAWRIPIQVGVPARPIGPCFACLPNSYGICGTLRPCPEPLAVLTITAQ